MLHQRVSWCCPLHACLRCHAWQALLVETCLSWAADPVWACWGLPLMLQLLPAGLHAETMSGSCSHEGAAMLDRTKAMRHPRAELAFWPKVCSVVRICRTRPGPAVCSRGGSVPLPFPCIKHAYCVSLAASAVWLPRHSTTYMVEVNTCSCHHMPQLS